MTLQDAINKYLGNTYTINWAKMPGMDRKGATIPQDTLNARITDIYETFEGRIVFLSDKTFTPFSIELLK